MSRNENRDKILSKLFHLIDILDLGDSQTGTECENCGTRFSQQILCPHCGKPYNWTLSDYKQHAPLFEWFADNVNHIRMIAESATPPTATEPAQGKRPMYGVSSVTSIHGKTRYSVAGNIFATEAEAQAEASRLNAGTRETE